LNTTDANNNNNNTVEESGEDDVASSNNDDESPVQAQNNDDIPVIYHGEPTTDRKSKFQAHMALVHSLDEVNVVLAELYKDKKIATATHNIYAYRFTLDGVMHENRNDDGETGAGDKLLYTMEKLNCVNVVVVVTRWFGGTMLGADRFKHIVNVAKNIIQSKYTEITQEDKPLKKKLRTSEDVYNRIKWDNVWNEEEFVVGYIDRFDGIMEVPFSEFAMVEAPFHRVQYFSRNNEILWDRRSRLDKIFIEN